MATYPGNASLSLVVKDRVLSTFQQAVSLYKQGRSTEVVEGCTLILRMDPTFDPARKLLEKTRNPSSPVDVDSLLPAEEDTEAMNEARAAMAARDFHRATEITSELLRSDFTNEEARLLNDTAREKMEAAPFVDQFLRKSEMFARQGNAAAARSELEKARALDAEHPGLRNPADAVVPDVPPPSFSFGGSPSFVVDAPPPAPAPRSAAQASDFGFTFEEEKAPAPEPSFSGFSFDAPPPPAAPPPPSASSGFSFDSPAPSGPAEYDFSSSSPATGSDATKIQQYLSDGDRAEAAGDYQQAIDLWSRIFLIDVTNDEASHRIERAKAKRRETERAVEAITVAGEQAFNAGDFRTARAKFEEALRLDPGNLTSHDFLERMTNAPGAAPAAPFSPPVAPSSSSDIFDDVAMSGSYDSLRPPEAAPAKKVTKAAAAPVPARRSGKTGVIITIAAVILLAAGGWFFWSKFIAKPAFDATATQSLFRQADDLAVRGRYDDAIGLLRDVKPADPQHDKALELIADLQHKKAQAAEMVNGRPAAVVYDENIAAGRAAFDGHDYDAAKNAFDVAARIKPLSADVTAIYSAALQQTAKLDGAKTLFREQKYQEAIVHLDPLLQADPQNQSIRHMLTSAHFNLGAAALSEERLPDAMREFDEVLKSDPNDELAKRSRTLAERYSGQPKDLLYKIYVKYLPVRTVT
jgi:tetratricopeptide (TPR) repeat protein